MHWWELSRAEWLRSVLCHLVWDGPIATELRVTWLSDGLRINIICINRLYIFSIILSFIAVSSSDLEFCGTGRFGMFPTYIRSYMPRTGYPITVPISSSVVACFYDLRLHSSDLEFCVGLFYATAWFRSRVPWRMSAQFRSRVLWHWLLVTGYYFSGVWPGYGGLSCSWGKRLNKILTSCLYDFSYFICLVDESSRWDDTLDCDITIG